MTVRWTELVVFTLLFAFVTGLGFYAAQWRPGETRDHLDEWGLAGRKFGSWRTWFLLGGDIYTAYTFVAVPALVFGAGALGLFALPYTVIVYAIVFMPLLRMWSVCRVHGYVTSADFVQGRYGSSTLALVVALTGIVATMPYIALQLIGLEAVMRTMGLNGTGIVGHLPLIVAFVISAAYTYRSGLRAPALIAFVKGSLIYLVIVVAVVYLPFKLGGWGHIFDAADATFDATPSPEDGILPGTNNQLQFATLAFGSALALFLYPHVLTGALPARGRNVIKHNMSALPAYSLLLGLLGLLGYIAIAAGSKPIVNAATGKPDNNTIIPVLFGSQFPAWFAGVAYAAIGIGALVSAAIMSIAAANLWTRNIYTTYLNPGADKRAEVRQAKLASLVVKLGAVVFIVFIDPQYAIDLQLIGGVIILQTLPAVAISLYTRWFHRWGLLAGWATGLVWGVSMLYSIPNDTIGAEYFGRAALKLGTLSILGWEPFAGSPVQIYVGLVALVGNLVVAALVTVVLRQKRVSKRVSCGTDETDAQDYHADEGSPRLKPVAGIVQQATSTWGRREYDYVVVGGGSAGCVLAARLSEDPSVTVCLIEAGPSDVDDPKILRLEQWMHLLGSGYDWNYPIEPQEKGNSFVRHSRGKVLGGCSSHNSCIAFWPPREDLDEWAAMGCEGWSADECWLLLKRLESNDGPGDHHGRSGPVKLRQIPPDDPCGVAVLAAAAEVGLPTVRFNEGVTITEGAGFFQINAADDNTRMSSSRAYLHPIMGLRRNLVVRTDAWVKQVLFDADKRATGVQYLDSKTFQYDTVHARREVILSAGAIDTPKLLMLSGIGPAEHLRDVGIDVLVDSPGVGSNLDDHVEGLVMWEASQPMVTRSTQWWEIGLFTRTEPGLDRPDLMMHYGSVPFDLNTLRWGYPTALNGFCLTPNVTRGRSRGMVRLRTCDFRDRATVDPRYFTDPEDHDIRVLLAGVKLARRIAEQPALKGWIKRELTPGPDAVTDHELIDYLYKTHNTVYHPAGTARMGAVNDPEAVVDPRLRVKGVTGLRVADGSIMPFLPAVNPNITTMMIGEKASDLLAEDAGQPRV